MTSMTQSATGFDPALPRPEYPRPEAGRPEWLNLNGTWSFTFDPGKSGMERGLPSSTGFSERITVPFCPESSLSGVGHIDYIEMMWYHRTLEVPAAWAGKRLILHFGGVDYECEVFIDGVSAGKHWGGSASFSFDVTNLVTPGTAHNLVVYVRDETRSGHQPGGKQSHEYRFRKMRCHYTRTTGIWQTVWLEPVHERAIESFRIVPDLDGKRFIVEPRYYAVAAGDRLTVTASDGASEVARATVPAAHGVPAVLDIPRPKLWEPGSPFLYDLELVVDTAGGERRELADRTEIDRVSSYAGMRKVHVEGNRVYLNNRPLYQRLVLDQGFYPDGIWTAPNDEALKRDIELSMQAGFNGARLHQKVFEPRFHYWADRLGYLTWAESPSWGMTVTHPLSARNFIAEWRELVMRDRNHPSIITWTCLNETRDIEPNPREHYRFHSDLAELTHDLDPTRPVNDASGYVHVRTDLWTVHDYKQDPSALRELLAPDKDAGRGAPLGVFRNYPAWEPPYNGQPYIVDEYGGILWISDEKKRYMETSWGYGEGPKSIEEFVTRLAGLTDVILGFDHIVGYCYTQLTDVEQEQNGIYNADRTPKFDMEKIRAIFSRNPKNPA